MRGGCAPTLPDLRGRAGGTPKATLFPIILLVLLMMLHILNKLLLIASLLLFLLLRNSESLQLFPTSTSTSTATTSTTRRTFFIKAAAATSTSVIATTAAYHEVANAAIDVSSLRTEQSQTTVTPGPPGRAPSQPGSGPFAGTKLGFQVGGGPRPEEEVRKIDEPRYAAVRKAQGLGPLFLEGVPIEQQQQQQQ